MTLGVTGQNRFYHKRNSSTHTTHLSTPLKLSLILILVSEHQNLRHLTSLHITWIHKLPLRSTTLRDTTRNNQKKETL